MAFQKKQDPNGNYIRQWVPSLAELPAKYIYEPWTANVSILKKAGVKLGVDYPRPIVDHSVVSKENMLKMKVAYDMHKDAEAASKKSSKRKQQASGDASGPPKKKAIKSIQTKLK